MISKSIAILFLALTSIQAMAAECPAQFGDSGYEERAVQAIRHAATCRAAADIAAACAMGSSMDPQFTQPAERKCELDFLRKLSASEREQYGSLKNKCVQKYKNSEGTIYISANAFCQLRITELYSDLYLPPEP